MQQLTTMVLIAFGGALLVLGGYHALVVAPRIKRLTDVIAAHDLLLGGGTGKATDRLAALEAASAACASARSAELTRIEAIERMTTTKLPYIGFVRYNAFEDTGSDLSFAFALLTKGGDGVVVSSIWSREETRTYGKAVSAFSSVQDVSAEEHAAIARARAAAQ